MLSEVYWKTTKLCLLLQENATQVKAHTKIERNHLVPEIDELKEPVLKSKEKKNCLKLTFESIFYYVPCTLFRMFWVLYFS